MTQPTISGLAPLFIVADVPATLAFYREALKFRHAHAALVDGDIEFFSVGEPLLAFRRRSDGESLVCLYNLSPDPLRVTLTGDAGSLLSQDAERKKDKLTLGPNGFVFLAEAMDAPLEVRFRGKSARQA